MKYSIAAAATLFTAAFAAPAIRSDCTSYQIKDFTERKYDGKTINTVFFNILATNGGSLDFECSAYDPAIGGATENFEAGHVYSCGANSFFSFSFTPASGTQTNELFLWQNVSETETLGGSVFFDDPICRAGGSTIDDEVCSIPENVYVAVEMKDLSE